MKLASHSVPANGALSCLQAKLSFPAQPAHGATPPRTPRVDWYELGVDIDYNTLGTTLLVMVDDHERVSIYGRIFQRVSVDERIYCAPVADDDTEEDRLAAQHNLISRLLGNSLVSPAIRLGEPDKVLDCGYGGGDWSVEFAEEFEDCEVSCVRYSRWSEELLILCTWQLTVQGNWNRCLSNVGHHIVVVLAR